MRGSCTTASCCEPHVTKLVVRDPRRNALLLDGNQNDRVDAPKLFDLLYMNKPNPVYHHGGLTVLGHPDLSFDPICRWSCHMNSAAYFEIQADDPERAIDFYTAVFGWGFTKVKGLPIDYWLIQTEDTRGGLLKRPTNAPPAQSGTNAYVCSMQVTDYDGTAKAILKNGGQVALEKFAIPGTCWQGYFLDLEGNTFGLFQVDENAK